jgi:predicted RND superfamily exporter protein
MSGLNKVRYLMNAGEPGGINDPKFLNTVEDFSNWCLEQPEVVKVSSFVHTVKRLNKNMHGDDPTYYTIPENRELVAQYLLLYEMSLPFGQDLDNMITPDRSAISLAVMLKRLSTLESTNFERKAARWLAENAPPHMQAPPTGVTSMFSHISERNIKSMLKSTSIALFVISLLLMLAFRSWRFGLFSLIPNLVPALMTLGLWGLCVGYINMSVSFIAAMSLGIVVDDTVHFLSKYLHARRDMKLDPDAAIHFAFQTVGVALITTSLILATGFFVLYFSGFELNSTMGLLMAITIVFALFADFFLLPYLVLKVDHGDEV